MTLRGVVTLQTDLRANKAAQIIEFQNHNLWRSRRTPPVDLEARLKVNGKMWHWNTGAPCVLFTSLG